MPNNTHRDRLYTNDEIVDSLLTRESAMQLENILAKEAQIFNSLKGKKNIDRQMGKAPHSADLPSAARQVKEEADSLLGTSQIQLPPLSYWGFKEIYDADKDIRKNYLDAGKQFLKGEVGFISSITGLALLSPLSSTIPNILLVGGAIVVPVTYMSLGLTNFIQSLAIHRITQKHGSAYVLMAGSKEKDETGLKSQEIKGKVSLGIHLSNKSRVHVITHLAHEYAHHVQFMRLEESYKGKFAVHKEGHAQGVERHIANLYSEKEDNPAFTQYNNDKYLLELSGVYLWMCESLGVGHNQNLIKEPHTSEIKKEYMPKVQGKIDFDEHMHALGNAFFYIRESLEGKEIYRIKGDWQRPPLEEDKQ